MMLKRIRAWLFAFWAYYILKFRVWGFRKLYIDKLFIPNLHIVKVEFNGKLVYGLSILDPKEVK